MKQNINEAFTTEESKEIYDNFLSIVGTRRDNLVKKYGSGAEQVAYATAVNQVKKKAATKIEEPMENIKLKEMVKAALSEKPKKFPDLTGDGKVTKADILKARGVELDEAENIGLADLEEMGYEAGEDAWNMVQTSTEFNNKPDIQSYRKGFIQGVIDTSESTLSEDYKPSLRAYDVIDGERNVVYSGLSKDEAWKKFQKDKNVTSKTVKAARQDFEKEFGIGDINEDLDLGHQDNEPHMLKADLYRIGKYAMELYQMMNDLEGQGEVDLPHWWQSKISNAKSAIVGAKHYLDFELKEPAIDATIDAVDVEESIDREFHSTSKTSGHPDWKDLSADEIKDYIASNPKTLFGRSLRTAKMVLAQKEDAMIGAASKPLEENTFKNGDKVTYLGHPAVVTDTKEYNGRNFVSVSYDKGTGKTSASMILTTSGDVKAVNEMDINDPIMMKMRAAKNKPTPKPTINPEYASVKNAKKIAFLQKERAQLMRDMEQEAEPEGGPIADEYGSKLNRIDAAIAKLSGRKEMTYDQAIAESDSKIVNESKKERIKRAVTAYYQAKK